MHFICKKGKNLEIHPSFGYSWANYEKNKENFGKKCLVLPFWLGKSFDGVGKGFTFLVDIFSHLFWLFLPSSNGQRFLFFAVVS